MGKPVPEDFGLPATYDWDGRRLKIATIDRAIDWFSFAVAVLAGCLAAGIFITIILSLFGSFSLWAAIPTIIVEFAVMAWVYLPLDNLLERLTGWEERKKGRLYALAMADWQYSMLESGAGYWEKRTGRRFGEALKDLFVARGCGAVLMETSDKFVVNLIVDTGDRTFFCRCDGHPRTPISHETIRKVATLADDGGHRALIFVNCYEYGPEESALIRSLGGEILGPDKIANLAMAAALQAPKRYRSMFRRLVGGEEPPEIMARWPIQPEPIKLMAGPIRDGRLLI